MHFEDRFYFHRDISGQRSHSHRATRSHAILRAKNFNEQFAATIDDLRMVSKLRCAVHHAQQFDQPLHVVQVAKFRAQRGQNRQPHLARRQLACCQVEVRPHPARDERLVGLQRAVSRHVRQAVNHYQGAIYRHRFGRRRQLKF